MKYETRTFLLCDDESADYYVARICRTEAEVKPELWNLGSAETLPVSDTKRWIRDCKSVAICGDL
jgi:hypothetical protein